MAKNKKAFYNFCRAMGDDNDNCCVCPLQKICDERPSFNEFNSEREYKEAYVAWQEEANELAERAADLFNATI